MDIGRVVAHVAVNPSVGKRLQIILRTFTRSHILPNQILISQLAEEISEAPTASSNPEGRPEDNSRNSEIEPEAQGAARVQQSIR